LIWGALSLIIPTPMADYEHDIFISYRRMDKDWIRWTNDNFLRPLRSLLRPGLGNVRIFVDDQIETGSSWPARLARAHTRSRLLIPVLSRDYFNSDWCRLELALMYHREDLVGYRTPAQDSVLILPLVIDDGHSFPPEVQAMQGEPIHDFANPCMSTDGVRQEEFAAHLKQWCPRVEQALQTIPQYDPAWEDIARAQFAEMFRIKVAAQKTLPSLSLLPIPGGGKP
jgi:hypothetical protein